MSTPTNILLLLIAVLAVYGQSVFGGLRSLLGAQIDLLPALMVYAALTTSSFMMLTLAVAGGLLFDTLSANPLGVSILPLLIIGFLLQLRRDLLLRDQFYAQFMLGLIASALAPAGTLLILFTLKLHPLVGWGTVWQWLVMSLGGGLATPLLFGLFGWFDHTLGYHKNVETSFRTDREIRRSRRHSP